MKWTLPLYLHPESLAFLTHDSQSLWCLTKLGPSHLTCQCSTHIAQNLIPWPLWNLEIARRGKKPYILVKRKKYLEIYWLAKYVPQLKYCWVYLPLNIIATFLIIVLWMILIQVIKCMCLEGKKKECVIACTRVESVAHETHYFLEQAWLQCEATGWAGPSSVLKFCCPEVTADSQEAEIHCLSFLSLLTQNSW